MPETHITLYSDKSERFEDIKEEIKRETGMEPSNSAVVAKLMAEARPPNDRGR